MALIDGFGRIADDLRIGVTDRCNFRCVYCMPASGMDWLPRAQLLSFEEITRLARIFVGLGIRTIRLTGGEPTLRKDLPKLVGMLRGLDEELELTMTTNGYLLAGLAEPLARAGLNRVNVSIDSLIEHRFAEITRVDALSKVREGIVAAEAAGLTPIKLNCVVVRGRNENEAVDFARLARSTGWQVRFIEFMPLDADAAWDRSQVVTQDEIISSIGSEFPLVPQRAAAEPASVWHFADGASGSVAVIPSVSKPFCSSCNRIRITSDGQLRTCLFALKETDLRALLRHGAGDPELSAAVAQAVLGKEAGHKINDATFVRPERSMSMIGG